MRVLRDMQIEWNDAVVAQKPINHGLFAFYEPILLWARDQRIRSRFSKINLLFSLRSASGPSAEQWLDQVDGVYCFTWGVQDAELTRLEDLGWLRDTFVEAIRSIRVRFEEPELERLERYVRDELPDEWPLRHEYLRKARIHASTKRKVVPFLETRPHHTRIGVRVGDEDVTCVERDGPIWTEFEWQIDRIRLDGDVCVFLTKSGEELGRITIA